MFLNSCPGMQVWIDRAGVALYECRSLERMLVSHEVLMSTEVDPRPVDAAEQVLSAGKSHAFMLDLLFTPFHKQQRVSCCHCPRQTITPYLAGACAQYCGRSIPRGLLVCCKPRWKPGNPLPR